MSVCNCMELMQGARNKLEQLSIKNVLTSLDFEISPITEAISHRASIFIKEHALNSGLQLADVLVFATACEYSLCLCSGSQKHF